MDIVAILKEFGLPIAIAVVMGFIAWKLLNKYIAVMEQRTADLQLRITNLSVQLATSQKRIDDLQDTVYREMKELILEVQKQALENAQVVDGLIKRLGSWSEETKRQTAEVIDEIRSCFPDVVEKLISSEVKRLVETRFNVGKDSSPH